MEGDHQVKVLEEARLKSELAMYIWAQSEQRRGRRIQIGEEPRDNAAFLKGKETLMQEAIKLAGQKISHLELVRCLKELIGQSIDEDIKLLDPKNIASKISARLSS